MPNGGRAKGQKVYVSAARADARWAEWIAWQLLDLGYEVSYEDWDAVPGVNRHNWLDSALRDARHVVIVLSRSFLADKAAPGSLGSLDRSGAGRGLVPVRIDGSEAGGLLDGIGTIDLAGLGADEAQARLRSGFEAVGRGHNRPARPPAFPGVSGVPDAPNAPGLADELLGGTPGEVPAGASERDGEPVEVPRRWRPVLRPRPPALIVSGVVAALLAIGVPLAVVLTGGGPASADVFAEAAGDPPASADLFGVMPPEQTDVLGLAAPASSPPSGGAPSSSTPAGTGASGGTVSGSLVGLFGGTRDDRRCDPDKLLSFLGDRPELRDQWARAVGADPGRLGEFIAGLTPVVLRVDTLVTNHGVDREGRLRPYQAVLQAGTAVLVDGHGTPVVKCSCGNPLKAPTGTVTALADARVAGRRWPAFSPRQVIVVRASTVVVQNFVLQQVASPPAAGASPTSPPAASPAGPSSTGSPTPSSGMTTAAASTPAASVAATANPAPAGETPRWFTRPAGSPVTGTPPSTTGTGPTADRDFVPLGAIRWDQMDYTSRCARAAVGELAFPVRDGSARTSDGGTELTLTVVTPASGDLITETAGQQRAEVAVLLRCGPPGAEVHEIQVFAAGPNRVATLTAPVAHRPRVGGLLSEPFAVADGRLRTAADYLDPTDQAAPALRQEISWRWQAERGRFEAELLGTSEVARVPPPPVVSAASATDAVLITIAPPDPAASGQAAAILRYELRGDNGATATATAPGEVRILASGCATVAVTVTAVGPGGASAPAVTPPTASCVRPGPIRGLTRRERDSVGGGDIVGTFAWTPPATGGGTYTYRVYFVDPANPADPQTLTEPTYEYTLSGVSSTLEGVYVTAVNAAGEGPRVRLN